MVNRLLVVWAQCPAPTLGVVAQPAWWAGSPNTVTPREGRGGMESLGWWRLLAAATWWGLWTLWGVLPRARVQRPREWDVVGCGVWIGLLLLLLLLMMLVLLFLLLLLLALPGAVAEQLPGRLGVWVGMGMRGVHRVQLGMVGNTNRSLCGGGGEVMVVWNRLLGGRGVPLPLNITRERIQTVWWWWQPILSYTQ